MVEAVRKSSCEAPKQARLARFIAIGSKHGFPQVKKYNQKAEQDLVAWSLHMG